jgi:chemotaxis protein CheX
MDPIYIKSFIESVRDVFEKMVRLEVTVGEPFVSDGMPKHDISGIIGMTGDVVGSVVLSFPLSAAETVVSNLVGSKCTADSPGFSDAIGELANMVSGAAKARFKGKSASISTPSVVIGKGHSVARPAGSACISLPCTIEGGEFTIGFAIREDKGKSTAAA